MIITVDSSIRIQNPAADIKTYCKDSLTLDNPDYYKKERMGKWTGNTPREIWLYEKNGDELILPFGCLQDVWKMVGNSAEWQTKFATQRSVSYPRDVKLYPYQEEAVTEALKKKNGILVMPCGSGKTQCGIEMIARIGGRALWLTHTQDLLNQSLNRAKGILNLNASCYGMITAGKVNIGSHITFATVQTMCKLDLAQFKYYFDIIVVDECQHCCGTPTRVTQFYKVVNSLSARYKFGLTATPKRADGLERGMFALLGDVVHTVDRKAVECNTCPVKVMQIETGWMPDYDCCLLGDGTIDYSKVIDNMTHDKKRFDTVLNYLANLPRCKSVIVLANRVEYLQKLCDEYRINQIGDAVCLSGMGTTKKAKEERKNALNALNTGEIDCIFATYQLAKEGLDVPNLRYVILATPEKDETTVIQSVGRVGRKADGKEYGMVIDFVDGSFGMYKGWAKKRAGYYKKIDAEIL